MKEFVIEKLKKSGLINRRNLRRQKGRNHRRGLRTIVDSRRLLKVYYSQARSRRKSL